MEWETSVVSAFSDKEMVQLLKRCNEFENDIFALIAYITANSVDIRGRQYIRVISI